MNNWGDTEMRRTWTVVIAVMLLTLTTAVYGQEEHRRAVPGAGTGELVYTDPYRTCSVADPYDNGETTCY